MSNVNWTKHIISKCNKIKWINYNREYIGETETSFPIFSNFIFVFYFCIPPSDDLCNVFTKDFLTPSCLISLQYLAPLSQWNLAGNILNLIKIRLNILYQ